MYLYVEIYIDTGTSATEPAGSGPFFPHNHKSIAFYITPLGRSCLTNTSRPVTTLQFCSTFYVLLHLLIIIFIHYTVYIQEHKINEMPFCSRKCFWICMQICQCGLKGY